MKLVRIDVKEDSVRFEDIQEDSKYYLFKLLIANGLLSGTPFPNSGRSSVGAKSPLTGGIKEANVGGKPGIMLASHGIRALVFENVNNILKLIIIDENGINIESAEDYKHLGNYELHKIFIEKYGKNIGIYSIGPAGEYLYRNSSVAANDLEGYPSRHAARGGLGAVMGSKGIKAIIIKPSEKSKVKIKNLQKFREITKPFTKELATSRKTFSIYGTPLLVNAMSQYGGLPTRNFRAGSYERVEDISGEKLHEMVTQRNGKKRIACSPTCVVRCSNLVVDEEGNHITSSLEYETIALNGSNLMIDDLDTLAKIDHMCDDSGIDTIEFGATIGVAMDNNKINWGDSKKVLEILSEIKNGTENGRLYGNGVVHLANKIGAKRVPHVKGQAISGYDPRVFKGMSVTFATSPMGADHTAGAAIAGRKADNNKDYGELKEDKNKLDLSYELQVYTAVLDSLGACYFIGPSFQIMELVAKALSAMYEKNISQQQVINIGKDILKTELNFNKKAGISPDRNELPKFFKEESSDPFDLKVTLPDQELNTFWKRLNGI
ncbi:MAG: aldehyde ferredoxin oxidoreductase C-terminal domain-containing protein [Candidatus Lokiarchaeota archaeon]